MYTMSSTCSHISLDRSHHSYGCAGRRTSQQPHSLEGSRELVVSFCPLAHQSYSHFRLCSLHVHFTKTHYYFASSHPATPLRLNSMLPSLRCTSACSPSLSRNSSPLCNTASLSSTKPRSQDDHHSLLHPLLHHHHPLLPRSHHSKADFASQFKTLTSPYLLFAHPRRSR